MRKVYLFWGVALFALSGLFAALASVLLQADGMTHAEYARQAQALVCAQTVGDSYGDCPAAAR